VIVVFLFNLAQLSMIDRLIDRPIDLTLA